MTENKFNIICKVKGCKIKSNIEGYIETNYSEMAQGQDDFRIKIHLDFDSKDIPSEVIVSSTIPEGFEKIDDLHIQPEEKACEFELALIYTSAQVGFFTIEGQVRHEEYGTEIAQLDASYFYLKVPEIKIQSCTTVPDVVKRGDKFDVNIVLSSSAPQKIKGTFSGKLKPSDGRSSARIYELEMQKIALKDEREVSWEVKVPRDEENIADYYAEFKFESKETTKEAAFENVLRLKRKHDLQLNLLKSETPVVSRSDSMKIKSKLRNIGIEEADIKLDLIIDGPEGNSITLSSKDIILKPEEELDTSWDWQVPEDIIEGDYQLNVAWTFKDIGEKKSMPGETIEIKPRHQLDIATITTDKDYYLSGQVVKFDVFIKDTGTRAGQYPLSIRHQVLSSEGEEIFQGSFNETVQVNGLEKRVEWEIPVDISTGALDFNISVWSEKDELASRRVKKLINVEQPILLHFDLIQSPSISKQKSYEKYLLEGENIVSEQTYFDLKIHHLNSETKLLIYKNSVIGGINWNSVNESQSRAAKDIFFSYLIVNHGLNLETLRKMKSQWHEFGYIWAAKLVNASRTLSSGPESDKIFGDKSQAKKSIQLRQLVLKNQAFNRLIKSTTSGTRDLNDWQRIMTPLISSIKYDDFKNMREILKYTDYEKYGKSLIVLVLEQIDRGIIKDNGKLAEAIRDFIKIMNNKINISQASNQDTIYKSIERWYTHLKNIRIEIESNDQIAHILEFLYSIVMLKLITRIIGNLDSVLNKNKILKKQFVNLNFEILSYHLLNIEYQQNNIRYNRFMDENLSTHELSRHFQIVEQAGSELDSMISQIMQL
ncbi:MAG: hypothetical protein JSV49_10315, partial [Thermoplasmata archaeon]